MNEAPRSCARGEIAGRAAFALCAMVTVGSSVVRAANESDVQSSFGSAEMITLATGYRQPVVEAPATVTVITREAIEQLGARSLADVLNHVAGFRIVPSPDGRGTVIVERGRDRTVLFMVDNVPYVKGLIFGWQDLNDVLLYDIERIEVVRGPASAVYGADAAGGVINIITRSHSGLTGVQVGARAGSFASYDGWLEAGTRWRDIAANLYAGVRTTNQTDAVIARDAQSAFDSLYGTHASLAPGPLQGHRNVLDTRGTLEAGPWSSTGADFAETNFHTGAGIAEALDPSGLYDNRLQSLDLTYHDLLDEQWEINGIASYSYVHQDGRSTLYPPGAFGGAFPEGVLYGLQDHENRQRIELSALRRAIGAHDVRFGIGELRDVFVLDQDLRNFVVRQGLIIPTGIYGPGAGVGDAPVIAPTTLEARFAYAQDAWLFAPDWRLTTGLRWDDYWSFGRTINPRVGLVWAVDPAVSVKLVYGTAFTPPGLTSTSSNGIFGGLGNPALRPERSRSLDLTTSIQRSALQADVTLFSYRDSDLIQLLPSNASVNGLEYYNEGQARGWGAESDLKYRLASGLSLSGTYAFHAFIGRDQDTDQEVVLAAKHQFTSEASIPFASQWSWQINSLSVLDRQRPVGDPRPDPRNYTLVGSDLAWHTVSDRVVIRVGARNLFNADARDGASSPQGIYYDIPLPGREVFSSFALHW